MLIEVFSDSCCFLFPSVSVKIVLFPYYVFLFVFMFSLCCVSDLRTGGKKSFVRIIFKLISWFFFQVWNQIKKIQKKKFFYRWNRIHFFPTKFYTWRKSIFLTVSHVGWKQNYCLYLLDLFFYFIHTWKKIGEICLICETEYLIFILFFPS